MDNKSVHTAALLLAIILGISGGSGIVTFWYAEGFSYFSEDPNACANCHIMQNQLDSWQKASHHTFATCVECHLPHDFFGKYLAKATNGYFHSRGFTFQDFPEPIRITPGNLEILQDNCVLCHKGLVHNMIARNEIGENAMSCVHCHRDAGHGEFVGLGGPPEVVYSKGFTND